MVQWVLLFIQASLLFFVVASVKNAEALVAGALLYVIPFVAVAIVCREYWMAEMARQRASMLRAECGRLRELVSIADRSVQGL